MHFFDPAPHPRVKICGLTLAENAFAVVEAGTDAIGVNFWPGSKRHITPESATPWLGELAGRVCRVGVFVNPDADFLERVVDLCILDAIQLHGEESPDFAHEVSTFGLPVIKAIPLRDDRPTLDPAAYDTPHILLDAFDPSHYGGTGRTVSWDAAAALIRDFPAKRVILAGGLTPANLAAAVAATHPHAVDTASGVESAPGIKDPSLVSAFLLQAQFPLKPLPPSSKGARP